MLKKKEKDLSFGKLVEEINKLWGWSYAPLPEDAKAESLAKKEV